MAQSSLRYEDGDSDERVEALESALVGGARLAWPALQAINRRFEGQPFHPAWAPAPLPKRHARSEPGRSVFRGPPIHSARCASARRAARILSGDVPLHALINEKPGEIKAQILERDGKMDDREDVSDARTLRRHDRRRS